LRVYVKAAAREEDSLHPGEQACNDR
jgi:hypothetical protein